MDGRVLVGRSREIGALDEALRRGAAGERAIVMLTGQPGIGKTRLLEELAARTHEAGGIAVWGRTWEVGLTPAYWPWIQILGALETPDERAATLDQLDHRADAGARLARFEQVASFLRRRSQKQLLTLLIDDVHAADPSSLLLLEYCARALAGARVVFGIAARDGDASKDVVNALGRIQRGSHRLPLPPLDRDAVSALVGARVDPAASSRVWELSEGNPLFVEELLASLSSEGVVRLPQVSSVRSVIRDRVARLPETTGTVLAAAAVVGRDVRGAVVADMLGLTDAELAQQMAPAVGLGMVAAVSTDGYRFSHALVAEALADELDPSQRARLHLRAAQALERRGGGEASAVAHHLLAAGHLAAEAAIGAAERAAIAAIGQLAFEQAAGLLERALAALQLAAPDDRRRRTLLLASWAEALQHSGQHTRANELCDEAAAIARSLGDGGLLARVALVRGVELRFGHANPALIDALNEALTSLGDAAAGIRARLLARLAAAEQPAADPTGPVARARQAIALASDLQGRERLDVLHIAISALIDYVGPDELEPLLLEVLALATAAGDRMTVVHTLARLCFTALNRNDRAMFVARVADLRTRATALGLARWLCAVELMDSLLALLDGRFADSERSIVRAEELTVDPNGAFLIQVHRAMADWTRTAAFDADAHPLLSKYAASRPEIAAWIAIQRGDLDAARIALASVVDEISSDPDLIAMTASAIAATGTPEQASAVYALIAPRRNLVSMTSMVGSAVLDLTDRIRLILAAAAGRWDVIDEHALDAIAIAERLRSPVWVARVRADWADALERRRGDGDAARGAEQRALAGEAARRFGMPGLIERCRDERPVARPATAPSGVSIERTGELWTVRGFGEALHVKDSRGMQMLARLVAEPHRELHALDLGGGGEGADGGDAGELLDATARSAYRDRLHDLTAERDKAEAWGDAGRVERATLEIESLTDELERAVGIGGRARKSGSASERARSNVQRRVNHALQQIRAASPRLGEHLTASIRTGTYCCYEPDHR